MKKVYLLAILGLVLTSCGGIKTASRGLENDAFLEFVGNPSNYEGGLDVNIDGKTNFKAEVNKDKVTRMKGNVYAISTGTHVVSVTYKSQLLYKQQIFVSVQETKKISLP